MDIVFVALTLFFFVLSWAFLKLCDRLSVVAQDSSAHDGLARDKRT
jgi:hypothetical protein